MAYLTRVVVIISLALTFAFQLSSAAQGQSFDAFTNFRSRPTPTTASGEAVDQNSPPPPALTPFLYGFAGDISGGAFTAYNRYTNNSGGGNDGISAGDEAFYQATLSGAFNATQLRTIRETGNTTRAANLELTLRPDNDAASQYNIVRFVAPFAQTFNISGYFVVPATAGDAEVGYRATGLSSSSQTLAPGAQRSFNFTVTLAAGDFVDFYNGFGSVFSSTDMVFLNARITAIPEPSTLLLAGISLAAATAGALKIRRAGGAVDSAASFSE